MLYFILTSLIYISELFSSYASHLPIMKCTRYFHKVSGYHWIHIQIPLDTYPDTTDTWYLPDTMKLPQSYWLMYDLPLTNVVKGLHIPTITSII